MTPIFQNFWAFKHDKGDLALKTNSATPKFLLGIDLALNQENLNQGNSEVNSFSHAAEKT